LIDRDLMRMAAATWTQAGLLELGLEVEAELASGINEEPLGEEVTVALSHPERDSQVTRRKRPVPLTVPEATWRQWPACAGRNCSVTDRRSSEAGARPVNTSSCP
jgi:hypothetical protein